MRICSVPNCDRAVIACNFCDTHYRRLKKFGNPLPEKPINVQVHAFHQSHCNVQSCERKHYGKGFCRAHYDRLRSNGDPASNVPIKNQNRSPLERFFEFTKDIGKDECWAWSGAHNSDGYGSFTLNGSTIGAHRAAYILLIGPIMQDLELDHLCRNHGCVNPWHLEAVTHSVNIQRGISHITMKAKWKKIRADRKTCIHGHAWIPENIYEDKIGRCYCRICHAISERKRRHRATF